VSARILIVDDDADSRDITARLLQSRGYAIMTAASGPECLTVVQREAIDLILLDVIMPGMDGFEVCAALRALPTGRQFAIILLTGRDDLDARLEGMHHGVSEYLVKPINTHELFARVHAQLHILELTRQLDAVERNLEARSSGTRPSSTS
jgi:DNA-binding response OmpR family regulator